MPTRTLEIVVPEVRLALEDLIELIRGLDASSRALVARAVADAEMDVRFRDLIAELAAKVPATELSDADLDSEVRSVRTVGSPA